ncbi:hypothetical protein Btru_043190 [Bulinus truncatus]|nr:hypothetical protein Btru_043190 [Bulinus truncatus]
MPVQRLRNIDGDCKQNDVLVLRACQELNEECSDHIKKVEDSGEKTNTESLTHSMANEGKCIPHVVQECLSQSVESEENSQGTSHLSPKEEKFLSLRDRHVMSSLPPKKRKLRRSSRSSKFDDVTNLPQATTNNTELFHNDLVSTKVRENNLLHSDKEKTSSVSHLRKPLDCLRMRRSLDHRYMCPVSYCGATFSRKWNLDGHISKVHYKFSSLTCSVSGCQKTFSSKRDLRQHITMDHKGKIRKYKCSWQGCNKSFFARTHLRIHNLTHTGEKPVACDICDYRCRQRTALQNLISVCLNKCHIKKYNPI